MANRPEFTDEDLQAIEELTYALRAPGTVARALNQKYALGLSANSVKTLSTMYRRVFEKAPHGN